MVEKRLEIMKKTLIFTICAALAAGMALATQPNAVLQKAQEGDAASQNAVGEWCYNGTNGMKRDYGQALQWWAKAAKQGDVKAVGNMGMCYRYGYGIDRDSLKATRLYLKSIRDGNDSLMTAVEAAAQRGGLFDGIVTALAYKTGNGVKRDGAKAVQYFQMAAEGGSVDAQREYALICLNTGRQPDALEWFAKAAEQGDLSATYFCGMMKMKGLGGEENHVEGLEFLEKAASRNFPQACYDLSLRYAAGDGVEPDSLKAADYLRRAAVLGSHRAQWDYAVAFRDGTGPERSYCMAMAWMAIAADQGYVADFKKTYCDKKNPDNSAFFYYLKGNAYLYKQDYDKALECFEHLVTMDIPEGLTMKALTLVKKEGGRLEPSTREQCVGYLKAASVRDVSAKALLAYVYTLGSDNLSDEEADECVSLLQQASEARFPKALNTLGIMYNSIGKDYFAQAAACFAAACEEGMIEQEPAAVYAKYLREGLGGVAVDKKKAAEVEKMALKPDYQDRLMKLVADTWLADEETQQPPVDIFVNPTPETTVDTTVDM